MMQLYSRSKLALALGAIGIYVVGASAADWLSVQLGRPKSITLLFLFIYSAVMLGWIVKNRLTKVLGLCRGTLPGCYFIPLAAISTVNLWFGLGQKMPFWEAAVFTGSMLCVGFLEEIIFRGLLFKALEVNGRRLAVAVSAITFGLGHAVNLFNASGASAGETLCQIISAVAVGYLFAVIFSRSGSLLPCIAAHCVINCTSAFASPAAASRWGIIISAAAVSVAAVANALWIEKSKA